MGFGKEGVSVDSKYAENMNLAAEAGVQVTKMSKEEMNKLGTYRYDKTSLKYICTLKGPISLGDLPVGVTSATKDGITEISSSEPFRFTRIIHRGSDNTITDGGYRIELGGMKVKTETTSNVTAPTVAPVEVKESRTLDKNLQGALYFLGHVKNPQVEHLVSLLSKQDFPGAKKYLESITIKLKNAEGKEEIYGTLKKNILANWDKAASFMTYMYGSTESKSHQEYTQKFVDSTVRTSATVRSEERLAAKYGITSGAPESAFKV